MKKIIIFFTIVLCFFAHSQSINDTYFLPGIMSEYSFQGSTYNVSKTSLYTQVDHYDKKHPEAGKVIIGHSAGGLKALAFAGYASATNQASKVKGVVTIGAPLKGFTALARGKDQLNRDLQSQMDILIEGFGVDRKQVTDALNWLKDVTGCSDPFDKAIDFLKKPAKTVFDSFLLNDSLITDISPGSKFIEDYVEPHKAEIVPKKYETRKKCTGGYWKEKYKQEKTWWGKKYWAFAGWEWEKTYNYYQVEIPPVIQETPKINKNIFVGMIVGGNNDPIKILDDSAQERAESVLDSLEYVFDKIFIANSVSAAVCISSIVGMPAVTYFGKQSLRAQKAKNYVRAYKRNYGQLFGSTKNDSFITEDAQQLNLTRHGGTAINFDDTNPNAKNGIYRVGSAIHMTHGSAKISEQNHPEIWGTGGHASYDAETDNLYTGAIKDGGILKIWFSRRYWAY